MDEIQAAKMAEILGGETWQSGGDIWLVLIHRKDGHQIVISDEAVCEYKNEEAFEQSKVLNSILLIS